MIETQMIDIKSELLNKVFILKKSGKYEEAFNLLSNMKKVYPDDPEIYNGLSLIYFIKKDFLNAKKNIIKTISLSPSSYFYFFNIASIEFKLKNYKQAFSHLKKCMNIYNKSAKHLQDLHSFDEKGKGKNIYLNKEGILNAYLEFEFTKRGYIFLNDFEIKCIYEKNYFLVEDDSIDSWGTGETEFAATLDFLNFVDTDFKVLTENKKRLGSRMQKIYELLNKRLKYADKVI